MASDMAQMKNNAIVCNIGHFDNEIDMQGLENYPGIEIQNIKDQISQLRTDVDNIKTEHSPLPRLIEDNTKLIEQLRLNLIPGKWMLLISIPQTTNLNFILSMPFLIESCIFKAVDWKCNL